MEQLAYVINGTMERTMYDVTFVSSVTSVLFFPEPPSLALLRKLGFRDVSSKVEVVTCEYPPPIPAMYFYDQITPDSDGARTSLDLTKAILNPDGSIREMSQKRSAISTISANMPVYEHQEPPFFVDLGDKAWLITGNKVISFIDDNNIRKRELRPMAFLLFSRNEPNAAFISGMEFLGRPSYERVTCDVVLTENAVVYFQQNGSTAPICLAQLNPDGKKIDWKSEKKLEGLTRHDLATWFKSASVVGRLFPDEIDVKELKLRASGHNSLAPNARQSKPPGFIQRERIPTNPPNNGSTRLKY